MWNIGHLDVPNGGVTRHPGPGGVQGYFQPWRRPSQAGRGCGRQGVQDTHLTEVHLLDMFFTQINFQSCRLHSW